MIKLEPAASPPRFGKEQFLKTGLPFDGEALDWSPDGKWLLVSQFDPFTGEDIWILPVDGSRPAGVFIRGPRSQSNAHFSPDGRFVSYQSNELGDTEVYVAPFSPGGATDGRRWKISLGGGQEPRWRADGKELFFLSLDYALMSAKIGQTREGLTSAAPVRLFGGRLGDPPMLAWHFESDPEGKTFAVLPGNLLAPASPLRMALNWQN